MPRHSYRRPGEIISGYVRAIFLPELPCFHIEMFGGKKSKIHCKNAENPNSFREWIDEDEKRYSRIRTKF